MFLKYCAVKSFLFQILIAWCAAKYLEVDVRGTQSDEMEDVKESIEDIVHTGIYSHRHLNPSEAEVVLPIKVSRDGSLVSHQLNHEHEHARMKRNTEYSDLGDHANHVVHYNITVEGRPMTVDLRPSTQFLTPSLVVERRRGSERALDRPPLAALACHFAGSVRGQPSSRVAISACNGLAGMLLTEHGEYWIEPSNQQQAGDSEARPHVIFKRSAVSKVPIKHRLRRSVNMTNLAINTKSYDNSNRTKNNGSKEALDRRRRNYLERRRKRLEAMRLNPTKYRLEQPNLRLDQRRHLNLSETSTSLEQSNLNRTESRNLKPLREIPRRMRARRRRKKRAKNCATKQPPYQWNKRGNGTRERSHSKNKRVRQSEKMQGRRRNARSVSKPQHVEVLLVADHSMTEFHDKANLETYLLTIMNMVSSLYMDPSIGNYIKVVVVKIIVVEESGAEPALEVSTNADSTLASFCRWQHELNPNSDDHPHHHDVAILVTRQDICSQHDTPCSTLGVAHVAGMCKPERSCSVNEDNGIMLAHTITHELGHNFGLYHDTEKIGCHRREGATLHIMTPIFEADTVHVAWSRCSKRDVTNFLDAGLGECLGDAPSQEEYIYPEVPAGVTFDAARQCHLQFGAEAAVCAEPAALCVHLWCLVNNTCKTMLRPAAPGTTCGDNMWCQNQKCVNRAANPAARDGGWGPWGEWSACSRSCGAGVSTQARECDSPAPLNNGKYCIGDRSRYKVCNTEPCPLGEPSFRDVQCARYNNITYNNETIDDWTSYFDQDKPCELQCVPRSRGDVEMMGGFVADGTPCRQSHGARDLCIAGVCYKVGCDWVVESEAREDACGVCGGNGSACKTVKGIYTKGTTKQSGFSEVAVIPAGSRNVKIQEKVSPGNYISIGSAKTKRIYLNGARNVTLTEYFVAGAQAIYERDRDWEKVRIPGPIKEDIKVYQRIYRGKHRNPGVTYQYTVDRERSRRRYRYALSDWSSCSVSCGVGYARRYYQCRDTRERVVDQAQCYHLEAPRHDALMQQCSGPPCPPGAARWQVSAWTQCSPCAKPGQEMTRQRSVYCVDKKTNAPVDESLCDSAMKPMTSIKCADVSYC